MLTCVPSISTLIRALSWMYVEFCQMHLRWNVILFFILMYHSDWFSNIESSLKFWNKSSFIVYDAFYMLLRSVHSFIVEHFCIYIHKKYWFGFFFLWFWYQGNDGPLEWIWKLAMNLFFFFFLILWEEQILAPLCYVGRISLWGHLVLDICLPGGFLFLFFF